MRLLAFPQRVYEEEDYNEDNDEESEGLLLSIGADGKADLHKPEDFVQVEKKSMDLIQGFLKEKKEEFKKYCKDNERKDIRR